MQDADFRKLINRSRYVEWEVCKWYRDNVDPKTRLQIPRKKEFDIFCPAVDNVEVKEDKLAHKTNNYALEIEDQAGEKSGIASTTAGEFVLVDEDIVLRMKLTSLLFIIRDCHNKRLIQMGYTTKEGKRAWGYLVPRKDIIYSPYVQSIEKWFK